MVRGAAQVSQTAYISWVRPRALAPAGADALAARLAAWGGAVRGAADLLARRAPDLLTV